MLYLIHKNINISGTKPGLPLIRGNSVDLKNKFLRLKILFFLGTKFSAVDKVPWILSLPGGSPAKQYKKKSYAH